MNIIRKSGVYRRSIKGIADLLTPLAPRYRNWELKNLFLRHCGINISKNGVAIGSGFQCIDGYEENITIESYVSIGHNVALWAFNDIRIGSFCMLAAGVTFSNGWHDNSDYEPRSGPITIGPGCWIGTNATIIGNVHIGANSIVGAGSLVNRDVMPNTIVAGIPAKVISERKLANKVWHLSGYYYCPRKFEILLTDIDN